MTKINTQFKLPVSIFREGRYFIAYSPALDLATSGKSYEEVKRRFNEVVEIFFEELREKGTLREVLEELGWQKIDHKWQPPLFISHEYVTFDSRSLEKV